MITEIPFYLAIHPSIHLLDTLSGLAEGEVVALGTGLRFSRDQMLVNHKAHTCVHTYIHTILNY